MKALVIAGTQSGSGKTSFTIGLSAALKKRGLHVQTFKVGPDFLDPTYLALTTQRPCYNLDTWMGGEDYIKRLFIEAANGRGDLPPADVCIVEGVMGLYDGIKADSSLGSTAQIAGLLDLPVLLLSPAKSMARSFAATINGFVNFPDAPEFLGIVANLTGSTRHGEILSEATASVSGLPDFLGAIPRGAFPEIPSRHLGLISATEEELSSEIIDQLADAAQEYIDIDLLLENAKEISPETECNNFQITEQSLKLGVAMDEAFHFYYPDNLEALQSSGVELVEFSPLHDTQIPEVDALYIGGGYPECHADKLAANQKMKEAIRAFAESGRLLYAECGGLMYLADSIISLEGKEHKMCGVFPVKLQMLNKFKTLGYVESEINVDTILGKAGDKLKGHEYHYSEIVTGIPTDWNCVYNLRFARASKASEVRKEGFTNKQGNVLLTYLHTHFAANEKALASFIANIKAHKKNDLLDKGSRLNN